MYVLNYICVSNEKHAIFHCTYPHVVALRATYAYLFNNQEAQDVRNFLLQDSNKLAFFIHEIVTLYEQASSREFWLKAFFLPCNPVAAWQWIELKVLYYRPQAAFVERVSYECAVSFMNCKAGRHNADTHLRELIKVVKRPLKEQPDHVALSCRQVVQLDGHRTFNLWGMGRADVSKAGWKSCCSSQTQTSWAWAAAIWGPIWCAT